MIGRGAAEGNANLAEVGDGRRSEQAPPARPVRASSPGPWLALWLVALAGTIAVALSGTLAGAAPAPSPTVTASGTAAASFPAGALPGWPVAPPPLTRGLVTFGSGSPTSVPFATALERHAS